MTGSSLFFLKALVSSVRRSETESKSEKAQILFEGATDTKETFPSAKINKRTGDLSVTAPSKRRVLYSQHAKGSA
jgi:hypothetical protein